MLSSRPGPLLPGGTSSPLRLFLLLAALLALTGFRAPLEGAYRGVGTEAPDLSLVDLEGQRCSLSREAAGGWALVKFGTTWCPRCGDVVRELEGLGEFLSGERIRVVEVYLKEDAETVRRDLDSHPRRHASRVLLDPGGDALVLYRVSEVPRLFLVDPGGVVRLDTRYAPGAVLREQIAAALAAAR